jgi:hypothetical protein
MGLAAVFIIIDGRLEDLFGDGQCLVFVKLNVDGVLDLDFW